MAVATLTTKPPNLFPHQIFQLYGNYTCHLGNIYCETSLSLQLWLHKGCSQDITLMFIKELAPSIIPAINIPCTQTPVIKITHRAGIYTPFKPTNSVCVAYIDPDSVHYRVIMQCLYCRRVRFKYSRAYQ